VTNAMDSSLMAGFLVIGNSALVMAVLHHVVFPLLCFIHLSMYLHSTVLPLYVVCGVQVSRSYRLGYFRISYIRN